MNQTEKVKFIRSKGWYQWYNPEYWVHSQFDRPDRDHTNWGMRLEDAYQFETSDDVKVKIVEGMDYKHSAITALSNMAFRQRKEM